MARSGSRLVTALAVLAVSVGVTILSGCSSSEPARPRSQAGSASVRVPSSPGVVELTPVRFADVPGWKADHHADAMEALRRSCPKFMTRNSLQWLDPSRPQLGRVADWQQLCGTATLVASGDQPAREFFEGWFVPYAVTDGGDPRGLFTGYYEPTLHGSWVRTGRYTVPLYRPPPEAKSGRASLPSRARIEAGALAGRGLEFMWLDDPVDAFFLHIQGSGQVQMTDGSYVRVGYAGKNGHPYTAIGGTLIQMGEIPREEMSMQAIRAWLITHPDQAPSLMASNASYVFFRVVDGEGPVGAQGVPLRPGRSIAVDSSQVPYGVPVFLDTTDPIDPSAPLRRLLVAQDTGGAIKGPIRGDVFWGSGDAAALAAGLMKQEGRWFMLLPRTAAAGS